jgi:hypothetical protein
MRNFEPAKFGSRLEERMAIIVVLGRRRDQILLSPILDLRALEQLVADYEAAEMPCAAAALRRRLIWYQSRIETKRENGEGRKAALVSRLAAGELIPTF